MQLKAKDDNLLTARVTNFFIDQSMRGINKFCNIIMQFF